MRIYSLSLLLGMLIFSDAGFAETSVGISPIIGGNIPAARDAAVRDALWNAAMTGNVSAKTRSLNIDSRQRDTVIISPQDHLNRVRVENEAIEGEQISVRVSFDRVADEPKQCSDESVPLGNIVASWAPVDVSVAILADSNELEAIRRRFNELLARDARGWLAGRKANDTAVYHLQLSLTSDDNKQTLHYEVRGPNRENVVDGDKELGKGRMTKIVRYNLGYATLARVETAAKADAALKEAAKMVATTLRCLPAVVRARFGRDGKASLPLSSSARNGSIFLFARNFPVVPGGEVDMTAIDANLQFEGMAGDQTRLKLVDKDTSKLGITGYVVIY